MVADQVRRMTEKSGMHRIWLRVALGVFIAAAVIAGIEFGGADVAEAGFLWAD